jgi:hypothetical protein
MPDVVKIAAQVDVYGACLVLNDCLGHPGDRFMSCPLSLTLAGDPHPDALEIENRVLALKRFEGFSLDDPSGLLISLEGFAPGRIRASARRRT